MTSPCWEQHCFSPRVEIQSPHFSHRLLRLYMMWSWGLHHLHFLPLRYHLLNLSLFIFLNSSCNIDVHSLSQYNMSLMCRGLICFVDLCMIIMNICWIELNLIMKKLLMLLLMLLIVKQWKESLTSHKCVFFFFLQFRKQTSEQADAPRYCGDHVYKWIHRTSKGGHDLP